MGRCPVTGNGAPESLDTSPLIRVDLDIPTCDGVLCLVVRISLGIGAIPDLDVEVIGACTRLAVVLRLHPEGVQAIAIDRSCDLDMDEAILNIRYPKGTLPVRGFICPKCGYEVISFEDAKAASETAERLGLLEPEGTITRKITRSGGQLAVYIPKDT